MPVPDAGSPQGHFAVRLTCDRVSESEFLTEESPAVQIVSTASNRVLVQFPYAGDPDDDAQPLRKHIRVHWNADGTAVALSFHNRFYTQMLVYQLKGSLAEPESFMPVTLPDTVPVVKAMIPRFKEFRSRWHVGFQGWPGNHMIQFSAGTGALLKVLGDEDPNFMARYSFTVDIRDPKTPVIKRVERLEED